MDPLSDLITSPTSVLLQYLALDSLLFIVKLAAIVIGILIVLAFAMKEKSSEKISVKDLNKKIRSYKKSLLGALLDKKAFKKELKKLEDIEKDKTEKPRIFVMNFKGDIKASAADSLRETVTAVLSVATPKDEVVLVLESPGGMVHGYGLAASQLARIKDAGLKLTVCVDKIAASGGYMMACLADKIIAAPFAIVGSVGVVASIPNFNKILKKNDVDYYQITSGKYKRTVSLLGEVTNDGLEKFKEEIEQTHVLFKNHVKTWRPQVDVEKIATGEHWYGLQAKTLNLVDEISTSDDYIFKATSSHVVKEVSYQAKKGLKEKLAEGMALVLEKTYDMAVSRWISPKF